EPAVAATGGGLGTRTLAGGTRARGVGGGAAHYRDRAAQASRCVSDGCTSEPRRLNESATLLTEVVGLWSPPLRAQRFRISAPYRSAGSRCIWALSPMVTSS